MIKEEYTKRLLECSHWHLFQHPMWWDALAAQWDVICIHYKSETIYLPFSIEKKWGVRILRNPHLIPYLIPFTNHSWTANEKSEIASLLLQQLPMVDVLSIDLWPDYAMSELPSGFECDAKRTNLIKLTQEEEVYSHFKPALKRQIRKAERSLKVYERDAIEDFILLHQKTFDKQDQLMQVPATAYRQAWDVCKTLHCGKLFFIEDAQSAKHAALFCVYDNHCAYYLAGGTDAQYYGSGAMSNLMWHAIRFSLNHSIPLFDFEGSMLPNVNRFFQNFGPHEVSYPHLHFNHSALFSLHQKIKGMR